MYKLSKLAAGSVIMATAALGGSSAVLADGYEPQGKVVYERPSDWGGVYFGVSSGYEWSNTHLVNPAFPASAISVDSGDGLVGLFLGAQHQFGSIVLGVEGGWQSAARMQPGDNVLCNGPNAGLAPGTPASCTARFDDVLTAGLRAGWSAGHWMPYVTGGYANGGFEYQAKNAAGVSFEQAQTRLNGWYIGGGLDWKVSPGWTAGVEYRHYDFGDRTTGAFSTGTGGSAFAQGQFVEPARFDATTDTITARVSWKFSREAPAPLK